MRSEKKFLVQSISSMINDADYCYFVTYAGMTVKDITDLRVQLAAAGARCSMQKNALIKKAAEALNISGLDAYLFLPLFPTQRSQYLPRQQTSRHSIKLLQIFPLTFSFSSLFYCLFPSCDLKLFNISRFVLASSNFL